MFTGIIEEIGIIQDVKNIDQGLKFKIYASTIFDDLKVNDSICVNGVCLTTTKINKNIFEVTAVKETLEKSNLNIVRKGYKVNLERALRLDSRLGGHFVQGHVDCVAIVVSMVKMGVSRIFEIRIPSKYSKYIIEKGSIAVDGVSLTITDTKSSIFCLSIIPHTFNNTNMQYTKAGDRVNVEFDMISKYVEKILGHTPRKNDLTYEWFREKGF
jgi:riboflavin synthase